MTPAPNRRSFFKGFAGGHSHEDALEQTLIPPPWAWNLSQHCTQCDACIKACPERIILRDVSGWPVMDFTQGECTFCGDCAKACEFPVFDQSRPAFDVTVKIDAQCFAERGIFCRSCGDVCAENALRIVLQPQGKARVVVMDEACTGCGACVGVCPAQAVALYSQSALPAMPQLQERSRGP